MKSHHFTKRVLVMLKIQIHFAHNILIALVSVRLTGNSETPAGINSRLFPRFSRVIDWQPIPGVPCVFHTFSWDSSTLPVS